MTKKTPNILYKYRDWTNIYEKRTITHREFYLANPKSFIDKYDCNIPLDFESLTTKKIQKNYFEKSKEINPTFKRGEHRKFAKNWTKKGLMKDIKRLKQIESEYFDKFDKMTGVLSLTANPKIIELWKEYAANHEGFCIGISSQYVRENLEKFGSCGPVIYNKDFPSISPLGDDKSKPPSFITQAYHKLTKWDFEEEYRVFKMKNYELPDNERKIYIEPTAIPEVILGANMSDVNKKEVINIVSKELPHTKILQAELVNSDIIFHEK